MTSGGELSGRDPRSYLFSPGTYRNFILQADAKLNAIAPKKKTGSLYNFRRIAKSTIADGEWSRHTIAVIGNRILIQTNSELHVDYTDKESTYTEGHIALQQHDQASQVNFKTLRIKTLPDDIVTALEGLEKVFPSLAVK